MADYFIINRHGQLHSIPENMPLPEGARLATPEEITAWQKADAEVAAKNLARAEKERAPAKELKELIELLKGLRAERRLEQPNDGNVAGDVLPAVDEMKKFYPDYNPERAKEILDKLPDAWATYNSKGGRWGPSSLSDHVTLGSTTIGRYLNALKDAGIKTWKGIPLP